MYDWREDDALYCTDTPADLWVGVSVCSIIWDSVRRLFRRGR